jgi:hypothetical protein
MSIVLKIKFDPQRGGAQSYDFISPALFVTGWTYPLFSVLESANDINYTPLEEGYEWRADIDWENNELRLHILKDFDQIVYLALMPANKRNIPISFNIESTSGQLITTGWNTGALDSQLITGAYDIEGKRGKNIPAGFYEKFPDKRNVPVSYGISAAGTILITVAFNIGTRHCTNITAGAWLMGVARIPSEALILSADADPAASRVRGRTKEITLTGTQWEDLD